MYFFVCFANSKLNVRTAKFDLHVLKKEKRTSCDKNVDIYQALVRYV